MDAGRLRPVVLVCPGGGYRFTSDREAEPIAVQLCAQGFHACVLRYPVAPARFPDALCSLAQAVAWLRAHAAEYHIDANRVAVCGFSAGGHLAGSLGAFWDAPFLAGKTGLAPDAMRPDRLILSYPVVSAGAFANKPSFENLLGAQATRQELDAVSLELHVGTGMPPVFLWHTGADTVVPVENSMLLASALRSAGVPFELHIYPQGVHGLALANKETMSAGGQCMEPSCEGWLALAAAWLRR